MTHPLGWGMTKPKYGSLSADMIKRTVATKQTRIIGPDGQTLTVWAVVHLSQEKEGTNG